jgi:trans-aconitate methyltransferase
MLEIAASALDPAVRMIVDLGIGTGALSARCRGHVTRAKVVGIDADSEVLKAAAERVPGANLICDSFACCEIPSCDAVIASFALHHVRTRKAKRGLYARIATAIRRGGQLINVDCQPAREKRLANRQFAAWKTHLRSTYNGGQAEDYLAAWAEEDFYLPLDAEIALMCESGFRVEILWRKDAFAVLLGTRV